MGRFITTVLLLSIVCFSCRKVKIDQRPRVYILTDISSLKSGIGEPDDTQSMVRFLFYANEFDIEGFGATYTSHGDTIYPQYIKKILRAYSESFNKLKRHGDYPLAQSLIGKIRSGNPNKGIDEIGKGKDTELSNAIIAALKENSDQPLWILVWGGSLDLAQALWKITATMPPKKQKEYIAALRVYAIGDQYGQCGQWIRSHFKDLFFILNNGSFRGIYRGGDTSLVSSAWVKKNILSNSGALAQAYPDYDGGDPWGKVSGIKEGDSPSFLYLLPQSPGNPERPEMGSWGGKFKRMEGTNHYSDCAPEDALTCADNIAKWRADFQSDFLKRLSWLK